MIKEMENLAWLTAALPVQSTWESLEAASGDAPFILEAEDLDGPYNWLIANVPITTISRQACLESLSDRESRLNAIRSATSLFRPILTLAPDGTVGLLDGGHRIEIAIERGQSEIEALVRCALREDQIARPGMHP